MKKIILPLLTSVVLALIGCSTKEIDQPLVDQDRTLTSMAQMRTQPGVSGTQTELLGYYVPGDGGGGLFYWDANSTAADDSGTVISVDGVVTGRYIRAFEYLTPLMFGAKGDGSTLDSDGITKCIKALPSTGGIVRIPVGIWASLGEPITKANVQLIGQQRPVINAKSTALTSGSIIKGPLSYKADNLKFADLGIDSGLDVCNAVYGGRAQEGLICTVSFLYDQPQFVGLMLDNVVSLAKDGSSPVHALAVEGYSNATIANVETLYGIHGQAYKLKNSTVTNVLSRGAGGNGIIIKSDAFRQTNNVTFTNLTATAYNGITNSGITIECIQTDLGLAAKAIQDINLINPVSEGNRYGLSILCGSKGDLIKDVNIIGGSFSKSAVNGVILAGKTQDVTFFKTSANNNAVFGFETSPSGQKTTFIKCTADGNNSGFVHFGQNEYLTESQASNNTGFGFYAKNGAIVYRTQLSGSNNIAGLYGADTGVLFIDR